MLSMLSIHRGNWLYSVENVEAGENVDRYGKTANSVIYGN